MRKKIVWLPYDFDTAIGINNEGALVFSYNLEDIDHLEGGANVFNGQDSVVWKNIRDAFSKEITTMYQNLRSQGVISYAVVEQMFENHQDKWPEAIFNEDSYFKYLQPLVDPDSGAQPTSAYLSMLQGSKKEQRKWWLYNRFRYMDSKYNAGDALTDVIQIRGYAKDDITVTPYADVYASIKYGSYLVQTRAERNVPVTLDCPLDNVNDTEIYIYSASQLAAIGDLSGLKVGFADFSNGTKLSSLKVGDNNPLYVNPNLKTLYVGTNGLLQTIDVRNCSALGTDEQTTVDLSGATNIENVYFDGTAIKGCTLPNGGILKVLHLPSTVTNLTIQNQTGITDFTMPDYSNITTLRLENVPNTFPTRTILGDMAANSRVRLMGFYWECEDAEEIEDLLDLLDTFRGLDEHGNNTETAQVSGTIHTDSLTGNQIASYNARYPYLTVTADHVSSVLTYKTWDGATTISTVACTDGVPQSPSPAIPSRDSTAQYIYTAAGWSTEEDAEVNDPSAIVNVIADRTVYAAYARTVRTYTVYWRNEDNTLLETDRDVPYGTVPTYNGSTPTYDGETAIGWEPAVAAITGDTTYVALYTPKYNATFVRAVDDGGGTLYTTRVKEGQTPVYSGATPTTTKGSAEEYPFNGWSPTPGPIYADTTYTAQFLDLTSVTIKYLNGTITEFESDALTKFGAYGFKNRTSLVSATAPATLVEGYAFQGCSNLTTVELSGTSAATISANAFDSNAKLNALIIRSTTMSTLSNANAFSGTSIAVGLGAIYVPTAMVASYKQNSAWSAFNIYSINDYPVTDFSTISDTWAEIITAVGDGTYSSKYSIGDTKLLEIGTYKVYMQLAALDADNLASSGKAKTTWLAKGLYTTHRMNASSVTTGGWADSEMRSWLSGTVLPTFPSELQTAIKEVTKPYYDFGDTAEETCTDKLWIPSLQEVNGVTSGSYVAETGGVVYSGLFPSNTNNSNTARVKYNASGSAGTWWLRSAYSSTNFDYVSHNGSVIYYNANGTYGVALGFCI